ncbi:Cuticle protein 19 [Eumeta japonica]|uniref:Cuticle protein 19 n=1 Tax=Eumeta variegata TaxID=151549 RepID=A0A4C1Z2Y5_EUMVA|nr:Cuticle protein 19 [Eumeta japonica]
MEKYPNRNYFMDRVEYVKTRSLKSLNGGDPRSVRGGVLRRGARIFVPEHRALRPAPRALARAARRAGAAQGGRAVPVVTKVAVPVKLAVPVAHYVSTHQESAQGHGHSAQAHGHATSSQSIHREDVPAKAPADFYKDHGPAKYEFEYKVEDPHTGDNKFQKESRDGHSVRGVYSLHEADGSIRTVDYSSDKHQGFNANIKHSTKHIEQHKYHH